MAQDAVQKSPVTFRAQKLFGMETKTTRKILIEALGSLTDEFMNLLAKLDADAPDTGGDSNYAASVTPVPRITLK